MWPWSERGQVGASAAQKGGSGARVCRTRAGQHRIPLSHPKGGIAVSNMFEPAFASLSLSRLLHSTGLHWPFEVRRDAFSPLMQVGGGTPLVTCQITSCWYSDRNRGSPEELPRRWRAAMRCSSSRRGCQAPVRQVAIESLPPAPFPDPYISARGSWTLLADGRDRRRRRDTIRLPLPPPQPLPPSSLPPP
jgi:hypothetical protein